MRSYGGSDDRHNGSHTSVNISKNKQIFIIIRMLFLFHKNTSALGGRIMMNPNSWYIMMHLDRLQQELLDGYRNHVEDESQKKKEQSKSDTKMKKISDHHGL